MPLVRRAAVAAPLICLAMTLAPSARAATVTATSDPGGPGKGQTAFYGISYSPQPASAMTQPSALMATSSYSPTPARR